jgi:hypothetical protein
VKVDIHLQTQLVQPAQGSSQVEQRAGHMKNNES